ncbi:MAG: addiction module protein [Acidobacteria bacterium]|jgi:putative addiction module component (TIGR02574 family)|nr:addiction module protein [Acidobacteriota bacterium]
MNSKEILLEALRLPDSERAALAGELIESLDTEVDVDAEAAWAVEIHRRVDDLREGRAQTVSWAESRRRIHAAAHGGPRS